MENQSFKSDDIQSKIGYSFSNQKLLEQAFTRRSYANEHSECADNEVLEFYGDKVLSIYLAKWFEQSFAKEQRQSYSLVQKYYFSQKNEGELSKLFSYYSDTEMLSKCIWNLGLGSYLLLGKSDKNNEVWNKATVAEDLFEAILGAVAIDSNWNFEKIFPVCTTMLGAGKYAENYIRLLQDYCDDEDYEVTYSTLHSFNGFSCTVKISVYESYWSEESYEEYGDGEQIFEKELFSCSVDNCSNSHEAQMEVAKKGTEFVEYLLMKDCIGSEINPENPVSQLQELYQHNWIDEPKYIWEEGFDEETNEHFWICKIDLESFNHYFFGKQTTKKEAKKEAARNALKELLS